MKTVYIERNELFKPLNIILLNNILQLDENFVENNPEMFYFPCEECKDKTEEEKEKCEECGGVGENPVEYYQFYLTDADDFEVERLKEYGVSLGYSEKLEKWVIGIGDFGTSWSAFSYSKEVPDDYTLYYNETLKRKTVY